MAVFCCLFWLLRLFGGLDKLLSPGKIAVGFVVALFAVFGVVSLVK